MVESIVSTMESFHWDEIVATICGLIYVILAARNSVVAWIFGIVGSSLWAYGTYVHYHLFFDSILNGFYVIIGFYGIYNWLYGKDGVQKPIGELKIKDHIVLIIVGILTSLVLAYVVKYTDYIQLDYPYLDSLTTVFSLISTYVLVQRARSNWLYWIVIDSVYIYLYIVKEAYLYAILFTIYVIVAIIGYYNWREE